MFIDIGLFKQSNDTFVHDADEGVLYRVENILLECLRDQDIAARDGSEEFTKILPGTNEDGVNISCNGIINAARIEITESS